MKSKKTHENCFVCDKPGESKYQFISVKICSVKCKEIYFTTHDRVIIAEREQRKKGAIK